MKWTELEIGLEHKTDSFIMFFGNRYGNLEKLKEQYPHLNFRILKQVHGDSCVESSASEIEADAHYTSEKNIALCIRTADCTPILINSEDKILSIHAGWRGVMSNILPKSLQLIKGSCTVAMGPHIQTDSFQVDQKLGQEFAQKYGNEFVSEKESIPEKSYVNLSGILEAQLRGSNILLSEFWQSDIDTLSSQDFFSHRADPSNKGRNISFVARL